MLLERVREMCTGLRRPKSVKSVLAHCTPWCLILYLYHVTGTIERCRRICTPYVRRNKYSLSFFSLMFVARPHEMNPPTLPFVSLFPPVLAQPPCLPLARLSSSDTPCPILSALPCLASLTSSARVPLSHVLRVVSRLALSHLYHAFPCYITRICFISHTLPCLRAASAARPPRDAAVSGGQSPDGGRGGRAGDLHRRAGGVPHAAPRGGIRP